MGYTTSVAGVMRASYRRTIDKGGTWSGRRDVVALTAGQFSTSPQFTTGGSRLAVVVKFGRPGASPVWYQESVNFSATWSARTRVSQVHVAGSDPEPAGVALLSDRRLAGYNENRGDGAEGLWIRVSQ